MNTKRFFLGGISAGVTFFLLGWLLYGNLLADTLKENAGSATGVNRDEESMVFWALILGNFLFGFLLAYVFEKSGIRTFVSGFTTGGVVGFLVSAAVDLTMYGTTNLSNTTGVVIDIAVMTIISAIAGGVGGAVMGSTSKTTNT
jgi:uncharacterized membrane protein